MLNQHGAWIQLHEMQLIIEMYATVADNVLELDCNLQPQKPIDA